MDNKASFVLLLSLGFLFFAYPLFPNYPIHFFVPWLIYLSIFTSFPKLLWGSLMVGICMDIMATTTWGLHAFVYSLTTFLLCKKQRLLTYRHMTFLGFVLIYTILCELLRSIFYLHHGLTVYFIQHLLFLLSSMTFYTLFAIIVPLILWQKIVKVSMIIGKRLRT